QAGRADPGARERPRPRRGRQARRPRGHQPDAAVDPLHRRHLPALRREGGSGQVTSTLTGSGETREARPYATTARPRATTTAVTGAAVVVLALALLGSLVIGSTRVPLRDLWDSAALGHAVLVARWERGLV